MQDNRFSVTAIDGWTYYQNSEQTLEDYVRRLKRMEPPHPAAALGTAFHDMLEGLSTGNIPHSDDPVAWDYNFDLSQVDVKLEKPVVVETRLEGRYTTHKGRHIKLTGRVDAITHTAVIDYKTTSRAIDMENYMSAFQWRAYLSMYPMDSFRYEIFRLGRENRQGLIPVYEHLPFTIRPYVGMENEVVDAISAYDEFLQDLAADGHITLTKNGVKAGVAEWQVGEVVLKTWRAYQGLPDAERVGETHTSPLMVTCEIVEDDYVRVGVAGEPGGAPVLMARLYRALAEAWPGYAVYVGTEWAKREDYEETIRSM